jgi:1-acyl-sn-glycerol-3-phosphate acyltransferase
MPVRPWSLLYAIGYPLCYTSFLAAFSYRHEGSHHVPKAGPFLMVSNHQSYLDPVVAGLAAPHRQLSFLARRTLFKGGFFEWLIRSLGAIPVQQAGMAVEGMRAVLDRLEEGGPVLLFPEGERTHDGRMQPLKPGIHLLLRRAVVPVVPVGVAGAYDVLPRTRKRPMFSPLWWATQPKGAMAASVGPPLDSRRLAALPREQALTELFNAIQSAQWRAENLRRKSTE